MMRERVGVVTLHGNPLTLVGEEVKVGDPAPEAVVVDNNLSEVRLSSLRGKVCILAAVPSLDTPVCDLETRRFNQEAAQSAARRGDPDPQHGSPFRAEALVRGGRDFQTSNPLRPSRGVVRDGLWGVDQGTAAAGARGVRGG